MVVRVFFKSGNYVDIQCKDFETELNAMVKTYTIREITPPVKLNLDEVEAVINLDNIKDNQKPDAFKIPIYTMEQIVEKFGTKKQEVEDDNMEKHIPGI